MDDVGDVPAEVSGDSEEGTTRRPRWPWLVAGGVVLVGLAVVAFGWFGIHTAFIDDRVDEAGPVFDSGATLEGTEPAPQAPEGGAEPTEGAAPAPAGDDGPAVATLATGTFEGVGRYSGAGTAVVLTDGTEQRFVRFEDDFSTSNGPDLFVYLGTGSGAYRDPAEYVEIGVLRGNIGAQNYEIPALHPETGEPIDLGRFDHVAVWCKRFDATFAVAQLG